MYTYRNSVICTILFCCLILFSSCGQPAIPPQTAASPTATPLVPARGTTTAALPIITVIPTPSSTAQQQYTPHVILSGAARPDDLTFDQQRRLLFSDFYNGTVSRINANGTVSSILSGLAGPEGLVVLSDGTLIIAEQRTNRILSLAPGANSPTVLRALPGSPSTTPCKDGVDGIAFDATTQTLIVPDSPTGEVYRMSLDGKTLTLLASGIVRPVGAAIDAQGTIYVADECGGALWRITRDGKLTRIGGFGMPDDVVFDQHGNILVIDLKPSIHALIRMNLTTGKRETLASQGFIEPQGLVIDSHDDIFVSDDFANIIVEYIPR
jgi:DNA-binding beta-propeller fold protein YncE